MTDLSAGEKVKRYFYKFEEDNIKKKDGDDNGRDGRMI